MGARMGAFMDVAEVETLFTRADGRYVFARWGRPIVPVVFGLAEEALPVVKGAVEAVVALAGHQMSDLDMELGANLMLFFFSDWAELREVPRLGEMIPDIDALTHRLEAAGANQYRSFRFDAEGAIKAAFVFVRMDAELAAVPAEVLALNQAAQVILLWSDVAFAASSPLVKAGDLVVLRPEVGDVIRAAYDRVMPVVAQDKGHALRLLARLPR
jgi:hypothetical protein